MKLWSPFTKLFTALAFLGLAPPAYSLTIVPTFDTSITTNLNAAAMEAAINAAIQVFQNTYSDNVTVKIEFVSDTNVNLGHSTTWGNTYSYSNYLAVLRSKAADQNDLNALSKLPDSPTDPVIGGNLIHLTSALARMMGLRTTYGPDGFDATINLNTSIMNLTRPPTNFDYYDMQQVAEHEMDEVLGSASSMPSSFTNIAPIDLFRYTTNLARTFTTNGDNAYFSVDGTNLWARFNMHAPGDYADWWSYTGRWAPPGQTPHPQVQDAYTPPDTSLDLGTNEMAMLDVIGWTLALPASPTLEIVHSGANQITLSWLTNYSAFSLQERTNLTSGSWIASASGATNPAIIQLSGALKFYRLYQPAAPAIAVANIPAAQPSPNGPDVAVTRIFLPRQP